MVKMTDISNAIFANRSKWDSLTQEDKESFAFIFNRYFSKKYPMYAQCVNLKSQDKSLSMDMWFHFLKNERSSTWIWSKSTTKSLKQDIDNKDFKLLMEKLSLNKEDDLNYLINNHSELIKEELKYFKNSK